MASSPENISMAVFCDFENVALGVRDANYEKFDIKPVLERLNALWRTLGWRTKLAIPTLWCPTSGALPHLR